PSGPGQSSARGMTRMEISQIVSQTWLSQQFLIWYSPFLSTCTRRQSDLPRPGEPATLAADVCGFNFGAACDFLMCGFVGCLRRLARTDFAEDGLRRSLPDFGGLPADTFAGSG